MIYVHAYPFRVDDPERNIRGITTAAKDKALNAGDVLLFPFHALSGTVEDFWTSRPENRERNAHWLGKLAAYLSKTSVRVIIPAVMPEGVGVLSIEKGKIRSLDFEWVTGGVFLTAKKNGLVYVDYHGALTNETGGLSEELSADGCHPTMKCYARMEELVKEGIGKALEKRRK